MRTLAGLLFVTHQFQVACLGSEMFLRHGGEAGSVFLEELLFGYQICLAWLDDAGGVRGAGRLRLRLATGGGGLLLDRSLGHDGDGRGEREWFAGGCIKAMWGVGDAKGCRIFDFPRQETRSCAWAGA